MGCCVKSFREVSKKCPQCVKTVIHNPANVICNFKPWGICRIQRLKTQLAVPIEAAVPFICSAEGDIDL